MGTINDLFDVLSKVNIRAELPVLIKKTEYELVLKVINQRTRGIAGDGQQIHPSYKSQYYSKFKASLNPAPGYGTPDGKVTGAYNADLHVEVEGDTYTIDSVVDYADAASLQQYGNYFNLPTETSKNEYWDEALLPEILSYIHETIQI